MREPREETYRQLCDLVVDRLLLGHLSYSCQSCFKPIALNTHLVDDDGFLKLVDELSDR